MGSCIVVLDVNFSSSIVLDDIFLFCLEARVVDCEECPRFGIQNNYKSYIIIAVIVTKS